MKNVNYDVIVLGGGAGGVAASIRAAQLGGTVALIEKDQLGGVCMNKGCVPLGHMMAASHFLSHLSLAMEMGIDFGEVSWKLPVLFERQRELVGFMRQGVLSMLNKNKVTVVRGNGAVSGAGIVTVNRETFYSRKLIIATGSQWAKPRFSNVELPEVVNSDYLIEGKEIPERCVVVGEKPIAIEVAQFLVSLGRKVWLITKEDSLLPHESKPIRSRLGKALHSRGISILVKAQIVDVKKKKAGMQFVVKKGENEETILADLLISVERSAGLKNLGLESVGFDVEAECLKVNEKMETSCKGVYAIGDVTASEKEYYSHIASSGGIVAAENAMGGETRFDRRCLVRVAFTSPQVACVGLSSREAEALGYDVVGGSAPLSMNPYGMILGQSEGIIELVAEKKYGEILGIHILSDGAAEMAGQGVLAIQMESTLDELAKAVFPHPTLSESLAEAARDALGRPIYQPSGR